MKKDVFKKVLWAVDVFTNIPDLEVTAAKNISEFFKQLGQSPKVYPVCVFPGVGEFPFVAKEIQKRLDMVKELHLETLAVIPENMIYPSTVSDQVKTLVTYSENHDFDFIVLTTHAHKETQRYLMGSFTETLLHSSTKPVFVVDPSTPVTKKIEKVMLPINFEHNKFDQVANAVQLTKDLGAHAVYYHHVRDFAAEYFPGNESVTKLFNGHIDKVLNSIDQAKQKMITDLRLSASDTEFVIDRGPKTAKEAILDYQKNKKCDLIVLTEEVHGNNLLSFGSGVTRFVVEHAACSTLVYK